MRINTDKNKEYMKKYLLNRYYKRKKEGRNILGNKCNKCGSTIKLEFDHVNPNDKSFTICELWGVSHDRFIKEIKKCQILCKDCHQQKTREDLGQQDARKTHGTLSSYRYCKCDLCKKANSDWQRNYMIQYRKRRDL